MNLAVEDKIEKHIMLRENKVNRERYPQVYNKIDFIKIYDPINLSLKIIELYNIHQKKVST